MYQSVCFSFSLYICPIIVSFRNFHSIISPTFTNSISICPVSPNLFIKFYHVFYFIPFIVVFVFFSFFLKRWYSFRDCSASSGVIEITSMRKYDIMMLLCLGVLDNRTMKSIGGLLKHKYLEVVLLKALILTSGDNDIVLVSRNPSQRGYELGPQYKHYPLQW